MNLDWLRNRPFFVRRRARKALPLVLHGPCTEKDQYIADAVRKMGRHYEELLFRARTRQHNAIMGLQQYLKK